MNEGAYVKVRAPQMQLYDGHYGTVLRDSCVLINDEPSWIVGMDSKGTEVVFAESELEVIYEDVNRLTEPDVAGRDLDPEDKEWMDAPMGPLDSTNPKDALGVKKAPLRFVPPALRILAAPAMALGAQKYGPFNWRQTEVRMSVYLEAIQRHLAAFEDGEDLDPESGHTHLSHVAACLGIIADAQAIGKMVDDRPLSGAAPAMLAALDKTGEVN